MHGNTAARCTTCDAAKPRSVRHPSTTALDGGGGSWICSTCQVTNTGPRGDCPSCQALAVLDVFDPPEAKPSTKPTQPLSTSTPTPDLPFPCSQCPRSFGSQKALRVHWARSSCSSSSIPSRARLPSQQLQARHNKPTPLPLSSDLRIPIPDLPFAIPVPLAPGSAMTATAWDCVPCGLKVGTQGQ
jgi:hypothetical protein